MMNFLRHIQHLYTRHRLGWVLGGSLALVLMILGLVEDNAVKTTAYLLVLFAGFLLSEFIYFTGKLSFEDWAIEHPKSELYVIIGTQIIAGGLLVYWFMLADQQSVGRGIRLTTLALRILFVFPVFFLIYFLGVKKYTLRQLGIWRFNYWYVSLPIIVLIGGLSYLAFPDGVQFQEVLEENGYLSFITLGLLTAAMPEEITRNLLQSRLGSVLGNKSLAWFISSLVWAILHIPLFTFRSGDIYHAGISALGILPLGLLWGYLNQRYRSIIPALVIHATNLWGLQNLF